MKIGIATFQWSDNYGAVLQAYALQTFLVDREHDVQIVDYRSRLSIPFLKKWLSASPRGCLLKWEANWKKYLFERFRQQHLACTTEVFYSGADLEKIKDRFDLLISGSDQVWNPRWLEQVDGFFDLYFLSFAGHKTRRISYAASIGHSNVSTLTDQWMEMMRERLLAMDAISVREASSISLIQDLTGRTDAVQVVDPTLLLNRSRYDALIGKSSIRNKCLFSYMLHGVEHDAGSVADSLNLLLINCNARNSKLHRGYQLPSPVGWLKEIRDASLVVTNSFHATVFCLIFHTPFITVLVDGAIGSMNSRIIELLEPLGLMHRIVSPCEEVSLDRYTDAIDWDRVDQKMTLMKAESVKFILKQGL